MSDGKTKIMLWETAVTFRWEVGFALSFVRPVYHQVPIATEAVGDFICMMRKRKWMNPTERKKKKTDISVRINGNIHCSHNMHVKDSMQSHTRCWDRQAFYFLSCFCRSSSHCIKQEHRLGTSSLHWTDSCCGNSLIFQPATGTYCASTQQCM